MVVHEFRIPLPITVKEFGVGQLFMTCQASSEASTGDEGIEWLKNEPYDNTDGHWGTSTITGTVVPRNKGQYTLKRYHFKSKVPSVLSALAPANALFLVEEAWNAYPHCKTVLVNGYLSKETLKIDVESVHVDGSIDKDMADAVALTPAERKARKVEYLDISAVHSNPADKGYNPKYDLSKFKSAKTGRGPFAAGWEKKLVAEVAARGGAEAPAGATPLMCAYKVVRADCKIFGLQGTVENAILNQQRSLFNSTLAQCVGTLDEWVELSSADIRKMEEDVARRSNEKLQNTVKNAVPLPGAK